MITPEDSTFDPELVATSVREAAVPPAPESITYAEAIAECDRLQQRINKLRTAAGFLPSGYGG